MKDFIKFFTASCLGTIAALIALVGVFTIIGSISQIGADKMESNSVLMLDFEGFIPEKSNNIEKDPFDFESPEAIGLERYEDLIAHAATNPSIKGIVIKNPNSGMGQAKLEILRTALQAFRDSTDKFLFSYADYYSQGGYHLSSVADSIYLNPMGTVDIRGKATMIPFLKGMFDKLGVKWEIFYAGNFKSATEPFRREDMSEQNKIQTREFLSEMYDNMLNDIVEARSITKPNLHATINELKIREAEHAVQEGLVDHLSYYNEFEDILREKLDVKTGKKINFISVGEYNGKAEIKKPKNKSKNKIAVVFAEGEIKYNNEEKGQISEVKYHPIFNKIRKDDKIKALVMRVNSPGGSAFTSEEIWSELEQIKEEMGIPVVASFGTYAASGGYYISAGADTIVSEPSTLTGSIGVFSMFPNVKELMSDKLGITFDTVKTAQYAVGITGVTDLTEQEKAFMTESTNKIYDKFLTRVADGRGMTKDAVHEVAQGRVWTGRKAKELGLVDELGDLDRAIEIAAEMAGIEDYKLSSYPRIKKSMFEELAKSFAEGSNVKLSSLDPIDLKYLKYLDSFKQIMQDPTPQARLPFYIEY